MLVMMAIGMARLDRGITQRAWSALDNSLGYAEYMANTTDVLRGQLSSIGPLLDRVDAIIATDVNFAAFSADAQVRCGMAPSRWHSMPRLLCSCVHARRARVALRAGAGLSSCPSPTALAALHGASGDLCQRCPLPALQQDAPPAPLLTRTLCLAWYLIPCSASGSSWTLL